MIRAVIDTTVLISAVIRPHGVMGNVIRKLRDGAYIYVYSLAMIEELVDVITRPKIYRKYGLVAADVTTLLLLLQLRGEIVYPEKEIVMCRDPKDDKFLEAAVAGNADMIVTSDSDLLIIGEVEGIPILPPHNFVSFL